MRYKLLIMCGLLITNMRISSSQTQKPSVIKRVWLNGFGYGLMIPLLMGMGMGGLGGYGGYGGYGGLGGYGYGYPGYGYGGYGRYGYGGYGYGGYGYGHHGYRRHHGRR